MGSWKDELKKLRKKLPSASKEEPENSSKKLSSSCDEENDMSWKKGVNPLKNKSGAVRRKKSYRKKISKKDPQKFPDDNLPTLEAVRDAYGNQKTSSKKQDRPKKTIVSPPPKFTDLPQVTLTRTSEFKEPDPWVLSGAALQAPNGGKGRVLRIRIGVDFGTCFTKVAIRAADKVFFVEWGGIRDSNQRFFLPGELSQRTDGSTLIGRPEDAVKSVSGLKKPFLSSHYKKNQTTVSSTAFIGWVFRYVRAWLYRYHTELVQNRRLAWEVNIGIPTDPWCSSYLNDYYKNVGLWAWKLSQSKDSICLYDAENLINGSGVDVGSIGLDGFSVVPEFVAQVAGYVKSSQRQDGLHLLVDVGGGTVDVVSFNIFRKPRTEVDNFPIFSGSVEPLGTHMLMGKRISLVPSKKKYWADLEGIPTPEQFSQYFHIDTEAIRQLDKKFESWVSQCIGKILRNTKGTPSRGGPYPTAPEWKKGLRVFLTGGGASCTIYRTGVERAFRSIGTPPFFTEFPVLERVATKLGNEDFHRMSVAFGLTYDAESIGKIIRPRDIDNIPPQKIVRDVPDRDELYPK